MAAAAATGARAFMPWMPSDAEDAYTKAVQACDFSVFSEALRDRLRVACLGVTTGRPFATRLARGVGSGLSLIAIIAEALHWVAPTLQVDCGGCAPADIIDELARPRMAIGTALGEPRNMQVRGHVVITYRHGEKDDAVEVSFQ